MPIVATCACGGSFQAKDELAGKKVKCPQCGGVIQIANPAAAQPIPVACSCGKAFKARQELAGKQVQCPACGNPLVIPTTATAPSPLNPLGVGDAGDPLGLGPAANPLGAPSPALGAAPNPAMAANVSPLNTPVKPYQAPQRSHGGGGAKTDVLVTVTAVLCLLHGLGRIGSMWGFFALLATGRFFGFGIITSLGGVAVSAGIFAAGVGLLTKQDWAKQVGQIAAMGHFGLLAISLALSLISLAQVDNPALGGRVFVMMLTSAIGSSIVPGLLIYVLTREN